MSKDLNDISNTENLCTGSNRRTHCESLGNARQSPKAKHRQRKRQNQAAAREMCNYYNGKHSGRNHQESAEVDAPERDNREMPKRCITMFTLTLFNSSLKVTHNSLLNNIDRIKVFVTF